ncbi:SLC13 family permease [Haloferax denitrificans]|uniref:SLC13 family permease n=1 Tax=Haloferax denitrificans TaxID=35745 RepID=UPI003C703417
MTLAAAAALLLAVVGLHPVSVLPVRSQYALSVFVVALLLWLTKPVPYAVSSLACVSLLYALGVVDSFEAAVSGFTSSLVYFLLVLLLLGNAVRSVGLDTRLANRLLSPDSTPRGTFRSLARNVLVLALFMPSAMARAVAFIPIVEEVTAEFDLPAGSGFERATYLLLGHVNPIASMALMTGGGMALVTSGILATSVRPLSWVEWAVLMVPPTVALYALAAAAAGLLNAVDGDSTIDSGGSEIADSSPAGSGELTREQGLVAAVMAGTVLAWVVGSFVGLPEILPAVAAVTVLALPGVDVIDADDVKGLSWGVLFLIGATLSILDALEATRTIALVVDLLARFVPFEAFSHWQLVGLLLGFAVAVRVLFSTGSAAIVVILPIVLRFAETFGVTRLYLGLAVLLVVGSTTILPFNTTAVLVSLDRGPLTNRDVTLFGLVTMGLSLVVVTLSWLFYWPLVA